MHADLFHHRRGVFQEFQTLVKRIANAYPQRKIILRPHPAEDHGFWHRWCVQIPKTLKLLPKGM